MRPIEPRVQFLETIDRHHPESLREAVAVGLSAPRKFLPCRFFYDAEGSRLFERICRLPEYYPTRTERAILERYAPEIVSAAANGSGADLSLVEFGSGSSYKTRLLLSAALARQKLLHYLPIDISSEFLHSSTHALVSEYENLYITAIAAEYHGGLEALPDTVEPRLFLFLGSNIGNFTDEEARDFLARIRRRMAAHDRLLLGLDLRKDRRILGAAYNDSAGVTARFNKNLLVRINRELDADFDIDNFDHFAPYVERQSRIEMHLVSRGRQSVCVGALGRTFTFAESETIHTENSYKYSMADIAGLCDAAGLAPQACWQDTQEWFAILLLAPQKMEKPCPGLDWWQSAGGDSR